MKDDQWVMIDGLWDMNNSYILYAVSYER